MRLFQKPAILALMIAIPVESVFGTALVLDRSQNFVATLVFFTQMPGWFAIVSIWSVHGGGGEVLPLIVGFMVNVFVYWAIAYPFVKWSRRPKSTEAALD